MTPEYVRNAQPRRKSRHEIEQEERRSRMTTVAIVSCSAIAIIAIIIFLVALMTGELFKTELVTVPNFLGQIYYSGMSYDDLIIKAEHSYNSEYAKGVIFAQNPSGGTELVKGAQIKVSVSLGEEPEVKRMEDLRGLKQEDAISWLKGQGMNPLSLYRVQRRLRRGRDHPHRAVVRRSPDRWADGKALCQLRTACENGADAESDRCDVG